MCTGFVKKGKDIVYGYNLDVDPNVWKYKLVKTDSLFSVTIKMGSTTYFTHGVNKDGMYGVLPYMNDPAPFVKMHGYPRVDLIVSRLLTGKLTYDELTENVKNHKISNSKYAGLHALCSDGNKISLIEPGVGYKEYTDHAVISNFPQLKEVTDENPFYGKDRYAHAKKILDEAKDFTAFDGLKLLDELHVEGQWGTRLSFVYSVNEKKIYYTFDHDFSNVLTHKFN